MAEPEPVRRMPRAERREQILDAATRAFARTGYAATGLDDVAAEAGITRVLLYRHFDSKGDMYRAVLDRACARLGTAVGSEGDYDEGSLPALMRSAADDPDGFRLLFRHAVREPEFRDVVDGIRSASAEVTRKELAAMIPDGPWLDWAVQLVPAVTLEAVIAWLDAGQPDPDQAAGRIAQIVHGIVDVAGAVDRPKGYRDERRTRQ
ncbi:TetR/AcrR family transcriptional regulator [Amycolatopsis roodepoortensis]|uniref:TetR/AcrR family transcriptional regulator n=1 Tax=Amycolatopsis roodepoortensis TaxID=700274 RepID=UPI00214C0BB4|nr:TetR/AcrR family transcriptional regulator [Amycolatopsis roodepoortensis]UUV28667.1 TetR/AcrR family transcriptional regulator [Amycolatopsis roodepoortensis]